VDFFPFEKESSEELMQDQGKVVMEVEYFTFCRLLQDVWNNPDIKDSIKAVWKVDQTLLYYEQ
jgi:hypothetical protein